MGNKLIPCNQGSNKEYFSSYITGLLSPPFRGETIGYIYIPKKNIYPKIQFYFNKNNRELAESIKKRIGQGSIYETKTVYAYEIYNKEGIIKLIKILSPYMRTPKINKLPSLRDGN